MKYIEVLLRKSDVAELITTAQQHDLTDIRLLIVSDSELEQQLQMARLLVADDKLQPVIDTLQPIIKQEYGTRLTVLPVEVALPTASAKDRAVEDSAMSAREALFDSVEKSTRLDINFLTLVILSTIVAAIGLIESNVAVVIGAMVIAPFLGPNLAFGLGTALADLVLMRKAIITLFVGMLLVVIMSIGVGVFANIDLSSPELIARTQVGMDSVVLALASGAAAALSLTTGLSSVLVGVMVAVALLPPAATIGIMLGQSQFDLALGAALLLAINIVCVNLSCKLVFFAKGIRPVGWRKKAESNKGMFKYIVIWLMTLMILVIFITKPF
ncbi:TIGR00341 family protein [Flocculibacter collagenilyticus]|uniref:TIGR00341 family protein n=1 Tax=Flocculibacter collagenilyticus TaxID=2744479 RepID=UPI0018F4B4E3|nr:TIGR00341 family protein [Flocculibacter collagenilyticus]